MDPFLTRENAAFLQRTFVDRMARDDRRGSTPAARAYVPPMALVRHRMREAVASEDAAGGLDDGLGGVGGADDASIDMPPGGVDGASNGSPPPRIVRRRLRALNRAVLDALRLDASVIARPPVDGNAGAEEDGGTVVPPDAYREDETVLVINTRDRDWADAEPSPYDVSVRLDTPGDSDAPGIVLRHGAIRDVVAVRPLAAYVPRAAVDGDASAYAPASASASASAYACPFVVLSTDAASTNRVVSSARGLNGASVVLARDASAGSSSHAGFASWA